MTRREKQWRRILSTSLLDATVPSDEVSSKSDCENRTGKFKFGLKAGLTFDMLVLGLAGRHFGKVKSKLLKLGCRYVQVISLDILRTP